MDEPAIAEALLIEDGTGAAIGTRDDLLELAADGVPVIELGDYVAYPGFVDVHAHWVADRESVDVLDASPGEIRSFEIIATIVNGEFVFCSDSEVREKD
jgi:predicted amidohydrolase YtcJ